jgi:ArsR family transcriptional regulator, arsenate/arsenite/antimonite-responsive transcriptional repressor
MICSSPRCTTKPEARHDVDDMLSVLQALGDPSRLKIVILLREREQCVCHLTEALGLSQGTVSHHMSVLKKAGLIVDRRDEKDARWSYYSLSPSAAGLGQRIATLLDAEGADPAPADCTGR